MITAVLGWLAAALSMTLLWPQVWLSCIRRRTQGLSPTASWNIVARSVGWVVYALLISDTIQIVTNGVTAATSTAILVALLATQPAVRTRRSLAATATVATVVLLAAGCAAILALAAPAATVKTTAPALGGLLAFFGLVSDLPQPVALLRDRNRDLSGLSPARWWLNLTSCALWTVYGMLVGQPAVWVSAAFGVACMSVVCAFLVRQRWARPGEPARQDVYGIPVTVAA